MPIIREALTFTANEVKTNILSGSKFEFLPRPSVVRVYASQSTANEVELDFSLGNVVVFEDVNPNAGTAGAVNRDTDLIGQGVGAGGDRIQIRATETSGTTSDATVLVEIIDL